jgi:hypothetical protein
VPLEPSVGLAMILVRKAQAHTRCVTGISEQGEQSLDFVTSLRTRHSPSVADGGSGAAEAYALSRAREQGQNRRAK